MRETERGREGQIKKERDKKERDKRKKMIRKKTMWSNKNFNTDINNYFKKQMSKRLHK